MTSTARFPILSYTATMSQSTDVDDFWHLPPDRSAPKYLVRFAIITRTRPLSRLRDDSIEQVCRGRLERGIFLVFFRDNAFSDFIWKLKSKRRNRW